MNQALQFQREYNGSDYAFKFDSNYAFTEKATKGSFN